MRLRQRLCEKLDCHLAQVEADLLGLVREIVAGRPWAGGASTRDDGRQQELAATELAATGTCGERNLQGSFDQAMRITRQAKRRLR
jgi:hypothetical protein